MYSSSFVCVADMQIEHMPFSLKFLPQEHVTRICRIIQRPSGNAMLIGVGGSGKQSLSRLAAFICGFEVRQLSVTSKFKVNSEKVSPVDDCTDWGGVVGSPDAYCGWADLDNVKKAQTSRMPTIPLQSVQSSTGVRLRP